MGVEEILISDRSTYTFVGNTEEILRQKRAAYDADPEFRYYVNRHGGYSEYFRLETEKARSDN